MPYNVYILECADGTYYTGITSNLNQRLEDHQSGKRKSSYTFRRRPVNLVWKASFVNVLHAIEIEKKIKRWSAKKKKALIEEQWDLLKELSKKDFDQL